MVIRTAYKRLLRYIRDIDGVKAGKVIKGQAEMALLAASGRRSS
jgi:hypothetical protein